VRSIFKKRQFPEYLKPFGGSQWWAITTDTAKKLIDFLDKNKSYSVYHQDSFCPDEFFFHSILNYLREAGEIKVQPNLTFINWKATFDPSPGILKAKDFGRLIRMPEPYFFARKFDLKTDSKILNQLDRQLQLPNATNFISKKNKIMQENEMTELLNSIGVIKPDFDLFNISDHTFINALTDQSVIVDLGGNRGGFSKSMLQSFPCKKVITVEGNPELIPIIKENTQDFRKKSEVIHALIGTENAEAIDFHLGENPVSSLVNKAVNPRVKIIKTVPVRMVTMNYIYERLEGCKISLLKVDIEGSEWELLKKFTKKDYEKIDQITCEFHDFLDPALKPKTDDIVQHLTDLGYIYMEGTYESHAEYYDTLFCKPRIYDEYLKVKKEIETNGKNISFPRRLIELTLETERQQRYINNVHDSLSWKITAPLRKVASFLGVRE